MPPSDEGEVRVEGEMEVGTRLEIVDAQARKMEAIVKPVVPEAISIIAEASDSGEAEVRISLVPAKRADPVQHRDCR